MCQLIWEAGKLACCCVQLSPAAPVHFGMSGCAAPRRFLLFDDGCGVLTDAAHRVSRLAADGGPEQHAVYESDCYEAFYMGCYHTSWCHGLS